MKKSLEIRNIISENSRYFYFYSFARMSFFVTLPVHLKINDDDDDDELFLLYGWSKKGV